MKQACAHMPWAVGNARPILVFRMTCFAEDIAAFHAGEDTASSCAEVEGTRDSTVRWTDLWEHARQIS